MSDNTVNAEMSPFIYGTENEKCDTQEKTIEPTSEPQNVSEGETQGVDVEMQAIADIFIAFDSKFEGFYGETRQGLKNVDERIADIGNKLSSIAIAAQPTNLSEVNDKLVSIETAVKDANLTDMSNELVSIGTAVKNANLADVSSKLTSIETIVKNSDFMDMNNKITSLDTMVNDKYKTIMSNIKEIKDGRNKNTDRWFQIGAIVITAILTYVITMLTK